MWKLAASLCCLFGLALAQYPVYPVQQHYPAVAYVPVYYPNNTYNNSSRWNNRTEGCLAHDYDLPGAHSLFVGCVLRNDTLLYNEVINKPSRLFSIREKTIEYPPQTPPGYLPRNKRITAIRCYDLKGRGKGGFARIQGGGIGQNHVKLYLTSIERNRSLHFRVEIYGRP